MSHLLDTNIVIALMKGDRHVIMQVRAREPGEIWLSSIVFHELAFGAHNSDRPRENLARLDRLAFPILTFEEADATISGEIRSALKRAGTPIGPYDTLIAGQALARDMTLVTANIREFSRVEGLRLQNWLE